MQGDDEYAWMAAMRRGDFAAAWAVSDRILAERRARGGFDFNLPRHRQTIWDGRPLAGKRVLVRCYHGLGDTVMFIRFARRLREIARAVSVWVQPALLPPIAGVEAVDRVLPLHDGMPDVAYDADIEVMELAHALRVEPQELGDEVPYLPLPARGPRRDGKTRIGLVWGVTGTWAPERSIRLAELAPLLHLPHVELYALQRGAPAAEARHFRMRDIGSDDVETFAARLAMLDLLITVDSFPVHLAGAMGLPVWLLLPTPCDWRWMDHGTSTPWYPSVRISRQHRPGDWSGTVDELAARLRRPVRPARALEQTHPSDVRPL